MRHKHLLSRTTLFLSLILPALVLGATTYSQTLKALTQIVQLDFGNLPMFKQMAATQPNISASQLTAIANKQGLWIPESGHIVSPDLKRIISPYNFQPNKKPKKFKIVRAKKINVPKKPNMTKKYQKALEKRKAKSVEKKFETKA
jgi:hypothetical protein